MYIKYVTIKQETSTDMISGRVVDRKYQQQIQQQWTQTNSSSH